MWCGGVGLTLVGEGSSGEIENSQILGTLKRKQTKIKSGQIFKKSRNLWVVTGLCVCVCIYIYIYICVCVCVCVCVFVCKDTSSVLFQDIQIFTYTHNMYIHRRL